MPARAAAVAQDGSVISSPLDSKLDVACRQKLAIDRSGQDAAAGTLLLAAALSQSSTRDLTDVDVVAAQLAEPDSEGKARFMPDRTVRTFSLLTPDRLGERVITTLLIDDTPVRIGDLPLVSPLEQNNGAASSIVLNQARAAALLNQYGVRQLSWVQVQATGADDPLSSGREPVIRPPVKIRVAVPAVDSRFGPIWPMRRTTFALISCSRDGTTRARAYVGTYLVSSNTDVVIDVVVLVGAVWAFVAFSTRTRNPAGPRISWMRWFDPIRLTQDERGRGCPSRLQVFFFTLVVAATMTYILLRIGTLSDVSDSLLLLLGIGGASAAATSLVHQTRAGDAEARAERWLRRHVDPASPEPIRTPRLRDLVTVEGQFDVFRFQSLVFSLIVGLWILTAGLSGLEKVTIPPHVLELLGLSQVLYVGGGATQAGGARGRRLAAIERAIAYERALFAALAMDDPYRLALIARSGQCAGGAAILASPPPEVVDRLAAFRAAAAEAFALSVLLGEAAQRPGLVIHPVFPPEEPDAQPPPASY